MVVMILNCHDKVKPRRKDKFEKQTKKYYLMGNASNSWTAPRERRELRGNLGQGNIC